MVNERTEAEPEKRKVHNAFRRRFFSFTRDNFTNRVVSCFSIDFPFRMKMNPQKQIENIKISLRERFRTGLSAGKRLANPETKNFLNANRMNEIIDCLLLLSKRL